MVTAEVHKKLYSIDFVDDGVVVNGSSFAWDLAKIGDGYFHILFKGKSYRAELVKGDIPSKTFHIKLNGTIYPVVLRDRFDLLLEKMGLNNASAAKINHIKAPMPGLIIDLKVQNGDRVNAGEPLLILEAMKMENILKAPGEGVVRNVRVRKGDSVEKNQVLIEF